MHICSEDARKGLVMKLRLLLIGQAKDSKRFVLQECKNYHSFFLYLFIFFILSGISEPVTIAITLTRSCTTPQ